MAPTNAPVELSADAVARFARDLSALAAPGARVLVAVSGGPDSVALLLLVHAVLGKDCLAATVDHGLRAESGAEAAWVARFCAKSRIAHATLNGPLPARAGRTENLSARARALRYGLLEAEADRVDADHVATAHHADDQLETLVMRLNRGAGIAGLAGARARRGRVIRPLLDWRKAELAAVLAAQGIEAIHDPSNVSDRFDRARLRKALANLDWLHAGRWTNSARALGDAEDAIGWMTQRLQIERCTADDNGLLLSPGGLPFEIKRRLVERCVACIDPCAELRGGAVAAAVRLLEAGKTTMLGNVTCAPEMGVATSAIWRFAPAPPRRSR